MANSLNQKRKDEFLLISRIFETAAIDGRSAAKKMIGVRIGCYTSNGMKWKALKWKGLKKLL